MSEGSFSASSLKDDSTSHVSQISDSCHSKLSGSQITPRHSHSHSSRQPVTSTPSGASRSGGSAKSAATSTKKRVSYNVVPGVSVGPYALGSMLRTVVRYLHDANVDVEVLWKSRELLALRIPADGLKLRFNPRTQAMTSVELEDLSSVDLLYRQGLLLCGKSATPTFVRLYDVLGPTFGGHLRSNGEYVLSYPGLDVIFVIPSKFRSLYADGGTQPVSFPDGTTPVAIRIIVTSSEKTSAGHVSVPTEAGKQHQAAAAAGNLNSITKISLPPPSLADDEGAIANKDLASMTLSKEHGDVCGQETASPSPFDAPAEKNDDENQQVIMLPPQRLAACDVRVRWGQGIEFVVNGITPTAAVDTAHSKNSGVDGSTQQKQQQQGGKKNKSKNSSPKPEEVQPKAVETEVKTSSATSSTTPFLLRLGSVPQEAMYLLGPPTQVMPKIDQRMSIHSHAPATYMRQGGGGEQEKLNSDATAAAASDPASDTSAHATPKTTPRDADDRKKRAAMTTRTKLPLVGEAPRGPRFMWCYPDYGIDLVYFKDRLEKIELHSACPGHEAFLWYHRSWFHIGLETHPNLSNNKSNTATEAAQFRDRSTKAAWFGESAEAIQAELRRGSAVFLRNRDLDTEGNSTSETSDDHSYNISAGGWQIASVNGELRIVQQQRTSQEVDDTRQQDTSTSSSFKIIDSDTPWTQVVAWLTESHTRSSEERAAISSAEGKDPKKSKTAARAKLDRLIAHGPPASPTELAAIEGGVGGVDTDLNIPRPLLASATEGTLSLVALNGIIFTINQATQSIVRVTICPPCGVAYARTAPQRQQAGYNLTPAGSRSSLGASPNPSLGSVGSSSITAAGGAVAAQKTAQPMRVALSADFDDCSDGEGDGAAVYDDELSSEARFYSGAGAGGNSVPSSAAAISTAATAFLNTVATRGETAINKAKQAADDYGVTSVAEAAAGAVADAVSRGTGTADVPQCGHTHSDDLVRHATVYSYSSCDFSVKSGDDTATPLKPETTNPAHSGADSKKTFAGAAAVATESSGVAVRQEDSGGTTLVSAASHSSHMGLQTPVDHDPSDVDPLQVSARSHQQTHGENVHSANTDAASAAAVDSVEVSASTAAAMLSSDKGQESECVAAEAEENKGRANGRGGTNTSPPAISTDFEIGDDAWAADHLAEVADFDTPADGRSSAFKTTKGDEKTDHVQVEENQAGQLAAAADENTTPTTKKKRQEDEEEAYLQRMLTDAAEDLLQKESAEFTEGEEKSSISDTQKTSDRPVVEHFDPFATTAASGLRKRNNSSSSNNSDNNTLLPDLGLPPAGAWGDGVSGVAAVSLGAATAADEHTSGASAKSDNEEHPAPPEMFSPDKARDDAPSGSSDEKRKRNATIFSEDGGTTTTTTYSTSAGTSNIPTPAIGLSPNHGPAKIAGATLAATKSKKNKKKKKK